MSELKVCDGVNVKNAIVYDLFESVKASKYPFAVDTEKPDDSITDRVRKLGSCKMGEGHDNYLNGIRVAFDLTLSNKAWVEAERYHFLDFVSSQSTMHKIASFDLDLQYNEYVDPVIAKRVESLVKEYNLNKTPENYLWVLYNIPSGFQLTARMTTNYRQLKTIYHQRWNHRLPEWRIFCAWMYDKLPYFKELCLND